MKRRDRAEAAAEPDDGRREPVDRDPSRRRNPTRTGARSSRTAPDRGPSAGSSPTALRAAGVRYAFTVPGESFLGLLDVFEGAGIRVIATRHEGRARSWPRRTAS